MTIMTVPNGACTIMERRRNKKAGMTVAGHDGNFLQDLTIKVPTTKAVLGKRKRSVIPREQAAVLSDTFTNWKSRNAKEASRAVAPTPNKRVKVVKAALKSAPATLGKQTDLDKCTECGHPRVISYFKFRTHEHRYCDFCITPWARATFGPGAPDVPVLCDFRAAFAALDTPVRNVIYDRLWGYWGRTNRVSWALPGGMFDY